MDGALVRIPAMTLPGYFWDRWPYFAGKLSWDITTIQVNSALHPSGVAKSSTSFGWGKGGKVTSAGLQVTLCDLIWHVIFRSGVVISIMNCYIRFTYLLYFIYGMLLQCLYKVQYVHRLHLHKIQVRHIHALPCCSSLIFQLSSIKCGWLLSEHITFVFLQVLGCHAQHLSDRELWPHNYPLSSGDGCTCYNHFGVHCIASCASNIRNHEVRQQYGTGVTTVACSAGNFVLGCGIKPRYPGKEIWRTWAVKNVESCHCYDHFGSTCYAICGQLT